jgi:hypothetical protein
MESNNNQLLQMGLVSTYTMTSVVIEMGLMFMICTLFVHNI